MNPFDPGNINEPTVGNFAEGRVPIFSLQSQLRKVCFMVLLYVLDVSCSQYKSCNKIPVIYGDTINLNRSSASALSILSAPSAVAAVN